MPRPKKPTTRNAEYAEAAAALRDLNRLDGAQPARKCPPGTMLDPYRRLVPVKPKKNTLGAMLANDREKRPPAVITLPVISILTLADDDIGLVDDPWEQIRAERALNAPRKPS